MTPLTVKNGIFKIMSNVFNFLWDKVLSTQISHSQVKKCDRQLETKTLLMLYKEKNLKMPIKSVKMKISKKNNVFFLMSQGSFYSKIRFLSQKKCPVVCLHTETQTQTDQVTTEGTFSGFHDFFLQSSRIGPIITLMTR